MAERSDVLAAGAVVLRRSGSGTREVLLVHRPRYDDWSFPKGKLDRGEAFPVAAVREVEEETGLLVRLGVPLPEQQYRVRGRPKRVRYWLARVADGDGDVSGYRPNQEIDDVRWVSLPKARAKLTYDRDRDILDEAVRLRRKTRTLVVLRHGKARARKSWAHDDRLRPLLADGVEQSASLAPLLAAFGMDRVLSSSSTRCVQTVTPYAVGARLPLELTHDLSEEDATEKGVAGLVGDLLASPTRTVMCTHRPVLPQVLGAAGAATVKLEPAGFLVIHHRRGVVVAVEEHLVRGGRGRVRGHRLVTTG